MHQCFLYSSQFKRIRIFHQTILFVCLKYCVLYSLLILFYFKNEKKISFFPPACAQCRRITNPTTRLPPVEKSKITTTTTTELPISINDIEDLLQNVPTTTRRAKPTTIRTKPTTTSASTNDDLNFLLQVVSFI